MMIQGTKEAVIEMVYSVDLHGQRYYDISFRLLQDLNGPTQAARVPDDAIFANPAPRDRIVVHYLMNMVMKIEKSTLASN